MGRLEDEDEDEDEDEGRGEDPEAFAGSNGSAESRAAHGRGVHAACACDGARAFEPARGSGPVRHVNRALRDRALDVEVRLVRRVKIQSRGEGPEALALNATASA
jgi:hypothetical protein